MTEKKRGKACIKTKEKEKKKMERTILDILRGMGRPGDIVDYEPDVQKIFLPMESRIMKRRKSRLPEN